MKEKIVELERKLNEIVDNEFEKDVLQVDDSMVMACCDGLLRMDNVNRYMISKAEMRASIAFITEGKSKSVRKMSKTIKVLLIAAVVAALLAIGSLGYAQYKYNIFNFSDHSSVMFDKANKKRVDELKVGYIPDGFTLNYEENNKYEKLREYVKDDDFFTISKQTGVDKIDINTEYKDSEVTRVNGIDYIEYGEPEHGQGIIWAQHDCTYVVTGNIPMQELLKIAVSAEGN